MAKYTYKLNTIEFWRVGELESWYSDMAKKGYELVSIGFFFSKFKKSTPKQLKYRLEITAQNEINHEQLHLLEDSGWDYVTSIKYFHIFTSPVERNAPEIHSDPTLQAEAFQKLGNQQKRASIAVSFIGLLMLPLLFINLFIQDALLYNLIVENNTSIYIPFMIIYFVIGMSWFNVHRIFKVKKHLESGQTIKHDVPFKRFKLGYITLILIVTFAYTSYFFQGVFASTYIKYNEKLPIVTLEMFEKDETLYFTNDLINEIEEKKSLFVAPQYVSSESLRSEAVQYEDGSGIYEPTIWNEYYKLKIPFLQSAIFESVIEHERFERSPSEYTTVTSDYFDRIEIYKEEHFIEIIVLKGEHILKVRYFGLEEAEDVLAAIEEQFKTVVGDGSHGS